MIGLGLALAALVGLSLGMMGGGGSILTVPIFVYVLGYDAKLAVVMSLPVVGLTSLVGAVTHWRAGNVNLRTAMLFGVFAMLGAVIGARMSQVLSGAVQLVVLAVVMLSAAVMMFRSPRRHASSEPEGTAQTGDAMRLGLLIPVALGVGALTGVVGVGGGFLVVPALVMLGNVPMKKAVGTSLLVIAMNSAAAFAGTVAPSALPWNVLSPFIAAAVVGIIAGTQVAGKVSPSALKRGFAVLLVVVSGFLLFQNRTAFSAPAPQTVSLANESAGGVSAVSESSASACALL